MAPAKKAPAPAEVKPVAEVKAVAEVKPVPEVKPAVEVKAVVEAKPVAEAKAVEVVKAKAPATKKGKTTKTVSIQKTDETIAVAEDQGADEKGIDSTGENVVQVLADKITNLVMSVKDIQASLKPVLKEHDKLRKIVERIQKKRDNARKSPSGFAKPNKISDELCDFIGVPHGTEKSRTDITRYINAYVKEHNLNKPTNRRIILPDEKLKKILKINNGEEVTFFILQRLISHHFPVSGSKAAALASAAQAETATA